MHSSRPPPHDALPDTLPRGATIGRYVVVDVIGRGGMGVVYSAYDTQLDRKLAIKVLRHDLAAGDGSQEIETRLLREAQAMARLTHPNVVAVHDVGTFNHRVFLAMEFVDGCTLKEWLKSQPRTLRERLATMRAAGRGLAAAHAAGLVHRDFKPDNVLVGRDGRVLVTDFGLARAAGDATPETPLPMLTSSPANAQPSAFDPSFAGRASQSLDCPLTLTGGVLGTVGYLAPEQAFGEVTNAATDQFSFAVTLYFALYGERPFPGDSIEEYLLAVDEPVRDAPKGTAVPPWMRRVILRGFSSSPADRYPSLEALLLALDDDPSQVYRRAAWGLAGVLLLALGVGGTATMLRQKANECAVDPHELEGVWDQNVRSSVRAAFEHTKADRARDSAELVATKMDEFSQKWGVMRSDVCRATHVQKSQPEDVYRLRMACLDRQRTLLGSVSDMLMHADDQVVKKSLDVAYGLPQVAWCADVATLRASSGLPDDPSKRLRVVAVRDTLARSDSLSLAGKDVEAAELAHRAVLEAREIGHSPTTAEALFHEGQTRRMLGEFPEAALLLRESVFRGLASGADSTAVLAASLSAFIVGAKLSKPELAHYWLDAARAALERIGGAGGGSLDQAVLAAEADVLSEAEWHPELALPIEKRLLESYRAIYGVHPKTARAIYGIGVDHSYLGRFDEARQYYEASMAMDESIGGASYIDTGRSAYALGDSLIALGEFTRGEALLGRALSIFEVAHSTYWSAIATQVLTRLALLRGDNEAAIRQGAVAESLLEKVQSTSVLVPIVHTPAGDAYNRGGQWGKGLTLCSSAVAEQQRSGMVDPEKAYGWDALRCQADALIGLKRASEATPLLELSLTLTRRMYPGDYARAQFSMARALVDSKGDKKRALTLARTSRDEFARYPHLKYELGVIDLWLHEHG